VCLYGYADSTYVNHVCLALYARAYARISPPGRSTPDPPKGDTPHHYVFTVYALKTDKLDLPATSMPDLVGFMTHAAALGKATFTARYGH
jgi:phosphatidylethanolamine-binding protein (PEBP) family uncharacterized protein